MSWSINHSLLRSITPYLLMALVLALFAWRLMRAMAQARRERELQQPKTLASDQNGGTAVDFVLLFPLLLTLFLVILQIALIVQAKFVVNYAAFCAARSAVVVIPAKVGGAGSVEKRNQINSQNTSSPKMTMIQRAAALPCVAISPAWSTNILTATLTPFKPDVLIPMKELGEVFRASNGKTDISGQLVTRAHYAFNTGNTKVEIFGEGGDKSGNFDQHGLVRVRVTFRYYLTVPIANRIFGTSYYGFGLLNFSGFYVPITEEYTLVNEGEPPFPPSQEPRENDFQVRG